MPIKLFFDSDALIVGSASNSGAAFILLQLCELGILEGYTCNQVIRECRKNILAKLPRAKDIFKQIILHSLQVIKNPDSDYIDQYYGNAHKKDLPILASAINTNANYLVTFNKKHFNPSSEIELIIANPGEILQKIRSHLNQLADKGKK